MQAVHALVPAAGEGRRFLRAGAVPTAGAGASKLFLEVAGRPVLAWTLERLLGDPGIATLTVALAAEPLRDFPRSFPAAERERLRFVLGGAERQESVARCLEVSPATAGDLVLVHDGGRPCLSLEDLATVIDAASRHGAAVLGRSVTDTVKRARAGWIECTVDRAELFRAETPQVVSRAALERALEIAARDGFRGTDEASLLERAGTRVRAVEARFANPKLTLPEDLDVIEQILLRHVGSPDRRQAG